MVITDWAADFRRENSRMNKKIYLLAKLNQLVSLLQTIYHNLIIPSDLSQFFFLKTYFTKFLLETEFGKEKVTF